MKKIHIIISSIIIVLSSISIIWGLNVFSAEPVYSASNGNIRVGISSNDFSNLYYKTVSFASNKPYKIIDKSSNTTVCEYSPLDTAQIDIINSKFSVLSNDTVIADELDGPLGIIPSDDGFIRINGLNRKGKQAFYRGEFEVIKATGYPNKFLTVNILDLEDYLKGVVPNELPTRFGLEALKAQTVAARNYAMRPRERKYYQFDVCDSVDCQVYFGANTEEDIANRAIEETKGLYALYNTNLILALYSSTAGGYTENYENVFTEPGSKTFPSKAIPYLKGKPDIEGTPDFSNASDEILREYFLSTPCAFDSESKFFRWTREFTIDELNKMVGENVKKYFDPKFIIGDLTNGVGNINKITVLSRGVSGKAMEIQIDTDITSITVRKELFIRRVLATNGKILPSANFVITNNCDEAGNLASISLVGAGLGHGVGLSQYGAGWMSKNGYTFNQILQHYYDGISIGTFPVVINEKFKTTEQIFNAPSGSANVIIKKQAIMPKFKIFVNNNPVVIDNSCFQNNTAVINVDNYLIKSNNVIRYEKNSGIEFGESAKVWVEVYKAGK